MCLLENMPVKLAEVVEFPKMKEATGLLEFQTRSLYMMSEDL